jgi:hypothetical protein
LEINIPNVEQRFEIFKNLFEEIEKKFDIKINVNENELKKLSEITHGFGK